MDNFSYNDLEFILPEGNHVIKKIKKIKNVKWIFYFRHTYDYEKYFDVVISNKGDMVYIESKNSSDDFSLNLILDLLIISSLRKQTNKVLTHKMCKTLFSIYYEDLSFDLICGLVDRLLHL
jgi:hypothetical protein